VEAWRWEAGHRWYDTYDMEWTLQGLAPPGARLAEISHVELEHNTTRKIIVVETMN
jgi:hypothetical protein